MAGFLLSAAPYDLGATRYLAPIVWFAPFALSAAAHLLRPAGFALGMAPYLVSASIAGWVAYGSYVQGPVPQLHARRIARAEAQLGAMLRQKGIRYAAADYWQSYRLSFLLGEDPIVIPLDGDRYPPYRHAFEAAPVVAYLLRPSDPRAASIEYQLRAAKARYERLETAGFIVLVMRRSL
jgi:hypothetical protein